MSSVNGVPRPGCERFPWISSLCTIALLTLGGCQGRSPEIRAHVESHTVEAEDNPIDFINSELLSDGTSKPAVIRANDYRRVSGEYAYVDLESLLSLIGRIPGAHEVVQIRFFEGFAARVQVSEEYYNCVLDTKRRWKIVGYGRWSH